MINDIKSFPKVHIYFIFLTLLKNLIFLFLVKTFHKKKRLQNIKIQKDFFFLFSKLLIFKYICSEYEFFKISDFYIINTLN